MSTLGQSMIYRERVAAATHVVAVVSRFYQIPAEEIVGEIKALEVAEARHVAMWICRAAYLWDFNEIARLFQRDHTSVIHGIRTITRRAKESRHLHRRIIRIAQHAAQGGIA